MSANDPALIYRQKASVFMARPENKLCPVTGQKAVIIHHKKGRAGTNYLDESTWLAVSEQGHGIIHGKPEEAVAKGWLDVSMLHNYEPVPLGDVAVFRDGKLNINVRVLGRRSFFGRSEVLITPMIGSGQVWTTPRKLSPLSTSQPS